MRCIPSTCLDYYGKFRDKMVTITTKPWYYDTALGLSSLVIIAVFFLPVISGKHQHITLLTVLFLLCAKACALCITHSLATSQVSSKNIWHIGGYTNNMLVLQSKHLQVSNLDPIFQCVGGCLKTT